MQFKPICAGTAIAISLVTAVPAIARVCTASSGPQRVALLELYTSEGCSSCPPAERWMNGLPARKLPDSRLIALAFHVDYWNYIGWTDPYAQPRFSERQRQYARRRGANLVYTAQLLLNGADYRRGLILDDIDDRVAKINRSPPRAGIRLTMASGSGALATTVEAQTTGTTERNAQLYLALHESNLVSAVSAGENRRRALKHDFVVRELVGPLMLDTSGRLRYEHVFALHPGWKSADLRLAAFLQQPQSGDVLQAASLGCP